MDPSLPDPGAVPAGVRTEPVWTDNSPRPEDGPQDVSQDPSLDYSVLDEDDV